VRRGIDGQSLNAFERTWRWSCRCLLSELKEKRYRGSTGYAE